MTTTPLPRGASAAAVWPWWLAAALYFAVISLGHLEFSHWLVQERASPFGRWAFKDAVPMGVLAAGLVLLAWVVLAVRRAQRPGWLLAHWALWALCVAAADRWLTFSLNEYAHYPQYALLAWLLSRALDPEGRARPAGRILFWTTLAGLVDEAQQYLWLAPSYGEYLDINDVVVNLLGAQLGVLLRYGATIGTRQATHPRRAWPEWLAATVLAGTALVAMAGGRVVWHPPQALPPGGVHRAEDGRWRLYLQRVPGRYASVQPGPYRGRYLVLDPAQGGLLLIVLGVVFTHLPAGVRQPPSPAAARSG